MPDSLNKSQQINIHKDDWFGEDKARHISASFILTGISTLSLRHIYSFNKSKSVRFGFSISFSFGILKEVYDGKQKNNRFSYKDLTADFIGSTIGYFVFK